VIIAAGFEIYYTFIGWLRAKFPPEFFKQQPWIEKVLDHLRNPGSLIQKILSNGFIIF
jgi:hypothetical protein